MRVDCQVIRIALLLPFATLCYHWIPTIYRPPPRSTLWLGIGRNTKQNKREKYQTKKQGHFKEEDDKDMIKTR